MANNLNYSDPTLGTVVVGFRETSSVYFQRQEGSLAHDAAAAIADIQF